MKICIIQGLLPLYSIAFFNRIVELHPHVQLCVLADIHTNNPLNQYVAENCKFEVVHLPNVEWHGLAFRPSLLKQIRQASADTIVFSANPRDISQLWALLVCRLQGRHTAAWGMFHRIGGPRLVSKVYYRMAGLLASKCLTYSRTGASNLVNLGVPKNKVGIVGTAIDERIPLAHRKAKTPEQLDEFRREHGLEGRRIVLQVVRLSRIKRPELLVLAAERLVKQRTDLLFILIGNGEMREELEAMVEARGMGGSFRFLGGIYDEAVLSSWYMSADVFVVPTCIGLSAHHAMCYGLPIVTDDSLDSQASEFDILADGLNAMIYAEGSAESLAEAMGNLLSNESLRLQLGNNATLTVTLRHGIAKKANQFVKLFTH